MIQIKLLKILLILILFVPVQTSKAQDDFYKISGQDFFPDSTTLRIDSVTQIIKSEKEYLIRLKDTTILAPTYNDVYFYNPSGKLDSLVSWSTNDFDSTFLVYRYNIVYEEDHSDWSSVHSNRYFCTFYSGRTGDQWASCLQERNWYKVVNIQPIAPNFDSTIVQKIISDTTKLSQLVNLFAYYDATKLVKDSMVVINELGIESKLIRAHFYAENDLLIKSVLWNCTDNDSLFINDIRYEYDQDNNLTRVSKFDDKGNQISVLHTYEYDTDGKLVYEEVCRKEIGIKSRAYKYDSMKKVTKIREVHFGGGIFIYGFNYDENGYLESIIEDHKRGRFQTVSTFSYISS